MGKLAFAIVALCGGVASADPVRCDELATTDLSIDGLLDDWPKHVLAHAGAPSDGAIELRCAWDGTALALALDIKDDRVIRVRGGHEDHVDIAVGAGGAPARVSVYPGNAMAKPKIAAPPKVAVADSLQPKGFSIEARIPAAAVPGLSAGTAALDLQIVFHDADQATGGDDTDIELAAQIQLGDRADLLDDFLKATKLRRADIRTDTRAELDPERPGKERLVAGGGVIGVLSDRFAYVTVPDVKKVELLGLGPRDQQLIGAVVHQTGNGGARDLLIVWTMTAGRLVPVAHIEVKKEMGANVLEATWRVVRGARGPELWVEPKPAIGFTQDTWREEPADDADTIVLPWAKTGGSAYALAGLELKRRDLPKHP